MNKKKIFRWLKVIGLLYVSIGIALYLLQDNFLFHPKPLDDNYKFQFDTPFQEDHILYNKMEGISLVKFFPKDSVRRGVVLYFHGNMENINHYAKYADNFTKKGYEVWMEDYPGFGKSNGERNEEKLYKQAEQVYQMAVEKYSQDQIIIYGKSFGTGIAAYLASVRNNQQLILETPYYSIPALFSSFAPIYPTALMSKYKIPTYQYLQKIKTPITIFHGTNDWVIPYSNAARLKAVLKPTDEFITIEKGTHHNLNDFPLFRNTLDSLLNF